MVSDKNALDTSVILTNILNKKSGIDIDNQMSLTEFLDRTLCVDNSYINIDGRRNDGKVSGQKEKRANSR